MPMNWKHELILERVKGKRVLHIGATNAPYHVETAKDGMLLHQRLKPLAGKLVGMDFDRKAILDLKKLGIDDIFFGDIVKAVYDRDITDGQYDVILFADVIEHLDNPGIALGNIRALCGSETLVIITTPNAWSIFYLINHLKEDEAGHPDHRFWPSKRTMDVLLNSCGFETVAFRYCLSPYRPAKLRLRARAFNRLVLDRFPHMGQTLFYEVRPKPEGGE